jgi:hypothetical protein
MGSGPLFGAWAGDPIIVAGESAPPDEWGIRTATGANPGRNLYFRAVEEFEEISHRALVMLCELNGEFAKQFAVKARSDSGFLRALSLAVYQLGCKEIERELIYEIGRDWPKYLKI